MSPADLTEGRSGAGVGTDEALLACLPLTSCCAAQFLTGNGLVPVSDLGAGDPSSKKFKTRGSNALIQFIQ